VQFHAGQSCLQLLGFQAVEVFHSPLRYMVNRLPAPSNKVENNFVGFFHEHGGRDEGVEGCNSSRADSVFGY
jgi:hypothetical protein